MKKIILFVFIMILAIVNHVMADWKVTFEDALNDKGIEQAVIYSLRDGIEPYDIFVESLVYNVSPQNTIKVLFCEGVNGQEIREIAESLGISDMIITSGYKKSIVECDDSQAYSQAYNPRSFGVTSNNSGGSAHTSPSTFLK